MNQRELLLAMVEHGANRADAEARFDETLGALGPALARAWSAEVPGVGSFIARVTTTRARQARNPFTGERITTPARRHIRIRFEPDPRLLDAIQRPGPDLPEGASDPLHLAFVSGLTGARAEIVLAGIGRFQLWKLPALRERVNPRTGAVIPAEPASRTVRFTAASKLKAQSFPDAGED